MQIAILGLIYVFFSVYGWLSVVNCGVALLRLLPRSTFTRQGQRLFAPAWEVSQLFLLCGAAALLLCFRHGSGVYLHPIAPLLTAAAGLIILRALFVLVMFEVRARSGLTLANVVFLLIALVLPLSLGAAGMQLLGSGAFWQSVNGWVLMGTLCVGLLAGGLSFVYFVVGRTPHDRLHQVSRLTNILLAACIGIGMQLAVRHHMPQLHAGLYGDFIILGAFTAVWQLGLWLSARERYMWWYLSILAVATPLLLGLAQRPFIAFPRVSGTVAFSVASGGVSWAFFVLISTLAVLLIAVAVIAGWLLHFRQYGRH